MTHTVSNAAASGATADPAGTTAGAATAAGAAGRAALPADAGPATGRSVADLVGDASRQISTLVRNEIRLAVAEMQQKGKRLGVGAGMFGGAGLMALYGGGALIAAVILLLALAMPAWVAALIVAVVLFAVAAVLALAGKRQAASGVPPVPEQAVAGIKQDIATVREGVQNR